MRPSAAKPFLLVAVDYAARLIGRDRFVAFLGTAIASRLMMTSNRRLLKGRLRRIHEHRGEPATQESLEAEIRTLGRIGAEHVASHFMARPEADPAPMELPLEAIAKARARGKGVILAAPHCGDTARALDSLPRAGVPLSIVFLDSSIHGWLGSLGIDVLSMSDGALCAARALQALADNRALWVNADFDYLPGGGTLPFFGAPVKAPQGPARLCVASGAPILPVCPIERDGRWVLAAGELIEPSLDEVALETAMLAALERFIGERPDHWWLQLDPWDLERAEAEVRRARGLFGVLGPLRRWLAVD